MYGDEHWYADTYQYELIYRTQNDPNDYVSNDDYKILNYRDVISNKNLSEGEEYENLEIN